MDDVIRSVYINLVDSAGKDYHGKKEVSTCCVIAPDGEECR
jgi:hypothetical protein